MNIFDAASTSLMLLSFSGVIFGLTVATFAVIWRTNDEIQKLIKDLHADDDK